MSTDETTELVTSKETVTLLANNTNALFSDDFEGTASNWTFINGTDNPWIIGTAVKNGGTKAFISPMTAERRMPIQVMKR